MSGLGLVARENYGPLSFVDCLISKQIQIKDKSETIKRSKNQTLIHCLKSVHIRNFLCVFFRVRTEYGDLLSKYPYSVRMRENTLCVGTLFFFTLVKPFNVSFYRQRL